VGTEITEKLWSNHLKLLNQDVEEITAFIPSGLKAKQIRADLEVGPCIRKEMK
jgi:hypothetical protein